MAAEAKLRAGLIPVPVMGMVAKCTRNTVNPIANGASTCTCIRNKEDLQTTQFNSSPPYIPKEKVSLGHTICTLPEDVGFGFDSYEFAYRNIIMSVLCFFAFWIRCRHNS